MKYKKKPIQIEAYQYDGTNLEFLKNWTNNKIFTVINYYGEDIIFITTLEGNMLVSHNSWIVKGIKNEFYPVNDDIFNLTYEKIES